MSGAMTTADLFRERGWGVGALVQRSDTVFRVTFVGREHVLMERCDCGDEVAVCRLEDWSLYRPTPPVPALEEWRELWATLEAARNTWASNIPEWGGLARAIDALKAKVTP